MLRLRLKAKWKNREDGAIWRLNILLFAGKHQVGLAALPQPANRGVFPHSGNFVLDEGVDASAGRNLELIPRAPFLLLRAFPARLFVLLHFGARHVVVSAVEVLLLRLESYLLVLLLRLESYLLVLFLLRGRENQLKMFTIYFRGFFLLKFIPNAYLGYYKVCDLRDSAENYLSCGNYHKNSLCRVFEVLKKFTKGFIWLSVIV